MKMLIIILFLLASCNQYKRTVSPTNIDTDSISVGTMKLSDSLSASINDVYSLKPIVAQTISKIKYYESQKYQYQKQIDNVYPLALIRPGNDSYLLDSLRTKLSEANNEIVRLKGELNYMAKARNIKPRVIEYERPAIEVPGDNSVVVSLDGYSRKGEISIPDNLTIYLIPYEKKLKRLLNYDSSCEQLNGQVAKYYNGLYFFNDVEPGRYIIKICTYFGNYKLIDKQAGKLSLTMQVAPPIQ